ncbi:hypothetical protein Tsubulata_014444, partial [Turnera subulata]
NKKMVKFYFLAALVTLVICLALLHPSLAQNSPQDYLRAHNAARASVGVGPVRWDNNVAAFAQNYVNKLRGNCKLVHSGGKYGENLAWRSGDMTAAGAVKMWVDEKAYYDYRSNSCVGGECGHYTQVVWRNSVRLGCAKNKKMVKFYFLAALVTLVICLALLHPSLAQNSPQDYLRAHNAARASVGVGPVRWDNNVAAFAQNYVNKLRGNCKLVHSGGKYGENLAWRSGDMTAAGAVKMWVDEKAYYDYRSNSCVGGKCGHYTQVVWRNSVRLGCAK